jgi:hypothetical protein
MICGTSHEKSRSLPRTFLGKSHNDLPLEQTEVFFRRSTSSTEEFYHLSRSQLEHKLGRDGFGQAARHATVLNRPRMSNLPRN